jgi:RNA polymerase sigma-70 factor (ECF subfamily)
MTEQQLLQAAQAGDEDAFGQLVDSHRRELYVHCYRMLGSPHDAEDALQEALLRAWRGLTRFEARSSLRSWLFTIATNASLRAVERRPQRVLPIDHGPPNDPHTEPGTPLTESIWIQPIPDAALGDATPEARYEQRESVELAFIAAVQLLPPRQRAVLLLRDVLGFSGEEVARLLDTSPASVYSALQRAHKTVDARLPARSQQATLRALDDADLRRIIERYVDAWDRGDYDALAELLTDDATISMPPYSAWYQGRAAVVDFLEHWPMAAGRRWPTVATRANGQLAFAHSSLDEHGATYPHAITVITLDDARISDMVAFLYPELLELFGVPES